MIIGFKGMLDSSGFGGRREAVAGTLSRGTEYFGRIEGCSFAVGVEKPVAISVTEMSSGFSSVETVPQCQHYYQQFPAHN